MTSKILSKIHVFILKTHLLHENACVQHFSSAKIYIKMNLQLTYELRHEKTCFFLHVGTN